MLPPGGEDFNEVIINYILHLQKVPLKYCCLSLALNPSLTFTTWSAGSLLMLISLITRGRRLQGSPVQEERNGPLPPQKPQEPSSNHTAPAPGELRGLHIYEKT